MKNIVIILAIAWMHVMSFSHAEQKSNKEIFAEMMQKKQASQQQESPECKALKQTAKAKYDAINELIAISKEQYHIHSGEIMIKDMFRVINELVKIRLDISNEIKAVCDKTQ